MILPTPATFSMTFPTLFVAEGSLPVGSWFTVRVLTPPRRYVRVLTP
jgi:hypothetical protein